MRLRIARKKVSSSNKAAADDGAGARSAPLAAAVPDARDADGAGALTRGGLDHNGSENGSKDESFFEARPWLDSDSEDDFYSVRGDFTPSRGSTPDHQRLTSFSGRVPVDRSKTSLNEKKKRLLELLQEKQHFDDELDSVTGVGSDLENSVHAVEHLKPSRKGERLKKSSKSGCFPSLIWKHNSFMSCRKKRENQKDK